MVNRRLLVGELMQYYYDNVVLYVSRDNDFEDIYKGRASGIPKEMQDYEIGNIGSQRKGVLDISVKRS